MLSVKPHGVRSATLVAIDSRLPECDRLVAGIVPGTQTIVLDPHRDGIEQIARTIKTSKLKVKNLHIISHGSPGCIQLGNAKLSLETIDRYTSQLQQWFSSDAHLLLYGCCVAAGDAGSEFIDKLHRLTGANIAASTSLTGCAALGGNWDLEVQTSELEMMPVLDEETQESYTGILATYSFNAASFDVTEGGTATVEISFTGTIDDDGESIVISGSDGTGTVGEDYSTTALVVAFESTDTSPVTVTVPVINDDIFEGGTGTTESIMLSLTAFSPGSGTDTATLNIEDNDTEPTIVIEDAGLDEPRNAGDPDQLEFPVTLSNPSFVDITIDYMTVVGTANTADFVPETGTLMFTAGNIEPNTPLEITILPDTDGDEANNETFTVVLDETSVTPTTDAINTDSDSSSDLEAIGTIRDSDVDAVPDAFPYNTPVVAPFSPPNNATFVLPNTTTSLNLTANDDAGIDGVSVVIVDLAGPSEAFPTGTLTATTGSGGTVSFSGRGNVQYQPASNFIGTDTFQYRITNEPGDRDSALVTVVVSTEPTANDDIATTTADTPVVINVLDNDIDPDTSLGDSISIFNGSVTQPANGIVSTSGATVITYTPNPGFTGTDVFQYQVIDAQGLVSEPATVTINGALPNAVDDFARTSEGVPVTIDVLANDTDPNGATLSVLSFDTTGFNGGTVERTLEGQLTLTPRPGFEGFDRFEYTVTDPEGDTDTAIVEVLVASVNQPPEAVDDTASTLEGTAITIDVLSNDSDPENQPIRILDANATSFNGGTVTIVGDSISYTPPPDFFGIDTFDYVIGDERDRSSLATVTITVGEAGVEDCAVSVVSPTPFDPVPTLDIRPGGDGNDTVLGDDNVNALLSGLGDDVLFAMGGDDNLNAQGGNDTLFGNMGNDFLDGDLGDDLIFAGRDDDFVLGNEGNEAVMADIGNDGVLGGNGNDILFGNAGNDRIDGEEGDDSIFGGRDADALRGSNGNDFLSGDRGNDTVQGGNGDDMLLGANGNDVLDGCQGTDELHSGDGMDTAFGGGGNDSLFGNQDNDVLLGGIGNDILFGGQGEDTLRGEAGDDRLSGDLGSDILFGGDGADDFILTSGRGIDSIFDFTSGEDQLVLTGGLTVERINLRVEPEAIFVTDVATGEVLAALVGLNESEIVPEDLVVG